MSGLTAEKMLSAYAQGVFPMAESADGAQLYWFDPPERGVLPIGGVHVSRSLRRFLRGSDWRATMNGDFTGVVEACADRSETWINGSLIDLYLQLHRMGHAHSLEVIDEDRLIGGIFGVSLGGAFFAESMFSRRPNASKAALIWMSQQLLRCGFTLWDTQYLTPHLATMGGVAVDRRDYHRRLTAALSDSPGPWQARLPDPQALLQEITQTS